MYWIYSYRPFFSPHLFLFLLSSIAGDLLTSSYSHGSQCQKACAIMLGVRDSQNTLLPAILNMIARTRSAIHRDIRCASVVLARLRFVKTSRAYSRKDRRRTGLVVIMAWCLGFHVKSFGLQKSPAYIGHMPTTTLPPNPSPQQQERIRQDVLALLPFASISRRLHPPTASLLSHNAAGRDRRARRWPGWRCWWVHG